ncbi:cytochrome P450 2F3-like [Uloborus diversus]|uniref:cytochrome P450 2F3-like n=1 Tax=Uloborus diversus TaxID=327109 RepID=UPI002409C2D2|nr:cytochrome P450 2F3-like [Uloborus diversus]
MSIATLKLVPLKIKCILSYLQVNKVLPVPHLFHPKMFQDLISLFSEPLVFISTLITVLGIALYHIRNRGLPPGPTGLPYFGVLFSLKDDNNHVQLEEFKKTYGDIFSFTVTGKLYISFGTVKLMREAYLSHFDCFDRTMDYTMLTHVFGDSVGFINGERWKTLKRFFTQAFREYGMVKIQNAMAGPVYDQVQKTMDEFKEANGKPIQLISVFIDRCSTIIRRTIFGEDGISHQELLDLTEAYFIVTKGMTVTKLLMAGPMTRYILFPLISDCRNALSSHRSMVKILKSVIERHESKFDENNVRDVIDSYLKERKDRQAKNDPSATYFSNEALVSSLKQFVGDGISAVAAFIVSFLTGLVEHPEEQDKLYSEISDVVGTDRHPTTEDKSSLPYTNAYIYEVLRTTNFFTMFPSLECTSKTFFVLSDSTMFSCINEITKRKK